MYAIVSLAITFICYTGDDHHLHHHVKMKKDI